MCTHIKVNFGQLYYTMAVHTCPDCPLTFPTKQQLDQHLARKTPCNAGGHKCSKCDKGLKTAKTRRRHEKICKGKGTTLEDVQAQLDRVHAELANKDAAQQELFQVVNAASAAAVQNIVNNITNNTVINNYTINIDQLNVHKSVGQESKSHLKGTKIRFAKSPVVFADWYKMLREPQHNHNVLVVSKDSKEALICLGDKWEKRDRDEALMIVFRADSTSLYDHVANRYASDDESANSFRYDYLATGVMQYAADNDFLNLRAILDTYCDMAVATTQQYLTSAASASEERSLSDGLLADEYVADQCIDQCQAEIQQHQNEIRLLEQKIRLHSETKRKIRSQLHEALGIVSNLPPSSS